MESLAGDADALGAPRPHVFILALAAVALVRKRFVRAAGAVLFHEGKHGCPQSDRSVPPGPHGRQGNTHAPRNPAGRPISEAPMPAPVIMFEHVVVSRGADDKVVMALLDGEMSQGGKRCVAIVICGQDTARALRKMLGSALDRDG